MAVSANVDIANMALQMLGQPVIGSLTDSGRDATICNQLFNQNRNWCLMAADWVCIKNRRALARSGKYAISAITAADPPVVTCATHTMVVNELVTIEDAGGMTQINDGTYRVYAVTSVTITLYDTDGTSVDASAYTAYTTGGYVYRDAGADWAYVYDLPSDCLKPLAILDESFGVDESYTWVKERTHIFTDMENAGLLYAKLETDPTLYDETLVQLMASRLAWMISMRLHSDKQLRAEMRAEYNAAMMKAKLVDTSGSQDVGEAEELWINAR